MASAFGSDLFVRNATHGPARVEQALPATVRTSPGRRGSSSGRVYITSHDGNIRCYLLRNGKIRFRKKIASAESPPIGRRPLRVLRRRAEGRRRKVPCDRLAHGADDLVVQGERNDLQRRGADEEHPLLLFLWRRRLRAESLQREAALEDDGAGSAKQPGAVLLDAGARRGAARRRWHGRFGVCLGRSRRCQKWRYDGDGYVYGSAAIWHGRVLIGDFGGGFHALPLKSGRQLWKRSLGRSSGRRR